MSRAITQAQRSFDLRQNLQILWAAGGALAREQTGQIQDGEAKAERL